MGQWSEMPGRECPQNLVQVQRVWRHLPIHRHHIPCVWSLSKSLLLTPSFCMSSLKIDWNSSVLCKVYASSICCIWANIAALLKSCLVISVKVCPSGYHYISSMWGRSGRGGVGVVCSCSTTPQHCGTVSFWCVPVTCSTSPHHHCGTVVRSCSTTSALWSCGTVVVTVVLWCVPAGRSWHQPPPLLQQPNPPPPSAGR